MMPPARQSGPERFYKSVECCEETGSFSILLDGKPVHTPARALLTLPVEALACEIAAEWDAQGEKIDPASMPMTKRANTAIDRVRGREGEVLADIVSYAGTDLLCYRAESPQGLVERQCASWDPVLEWARRQLGASFKVQTGISHVDQSEASLAAVSKIFEDFDYLVLTPLHTMTTLTGSALLALAHAKRKLRPEQVWDAAHVDEDWQISQWGDDAEAAARREVRRREFDDDVRFLELVRQ